MRSVDFAAYYVVFALVAGLVGSVVEITIGLPGELDAILIMICVLAMPATMHVQFYGEDET